MNNTQISLFFKKRNICTSNHNLVKLAILILWKITIKKKQYCPYKVLKEFFSGKKLHVPNVHSCYVFAMIHLFGTIEKGPWGNVQQEKELINLFLQAES